MNRGLESAHSETSLVSIGDGTLWRGTFYSGESAGTAPRADDAYGSDSEEDRRYANDTTQPHAGDRDTSRHGRSRSFGGMSIHSNHSAFANGSSATTPEQRPRETFLGFEGTGLQDSHGELAAAEGGAPYASTSMSGIPQRAASMNRPSTEPYKAALPALPPRSTPAVPPEFA